MQITSGDSLRGIRDELLTRGAELRERLTRVQADLRRDVSPLPSDAPDAAIVMENDEVLEAIRESARSELLEIQRALDRLEAGSYGLCEQCGERIQSERLRIVPYAVRCVDCAPDT